MKFRQYIPVKAGGSNPDPAVYCPANGYAPIYTDPDLPILVDPDSIPDDEIVFLFDTDLNSNFSTFTLTTNISAQKKLEIFDATGSLLDTILTSTGTTYAANIDVATYNKRYLRLVFSITTPSAYFTRLASTASSSTPNTGVLACYINAPELITLAAAFQYQPSLVVAEIVSSTLNITAANAMFIGSGILSFTLKGSWPVLTTLDSAFRSCDIELIDFAVDFSAPLLTDMDYFIYQSLYIKELHLPSLNTVTSMEAICREARGLEYFTMISASGCMQFRYAFRDCNNLKELVVPSMPSNASLQYLCYNNFKLRSVSILGINPGTLSYAFQYCSTLGEVQFPRETSFMADAGYVVFKANPYLTTIRLPDLLTGSDTGYVKDILALNYANNVSKIYGDCERSLPEYEADLYLGGNYYKKLREFNCPKLRVNQIRCASGGSLEKFDIDYANSSFTGGTTAILLHSQNLGSIEINRIFTALPSVTGQTIDISNNPGSAGCDPTIAEAKGWTVNT